jgi:hypothetical protein
MELLKDESVYEIANNFSKNYLVIYAAGQAVLGIEFSNAK